MINQIIKSDCSNPVQILESRIVRVIANSFNLNYYNNKCYGEIYKFTYNTMTRPVIIGFRNNVLDEYRNIYYKGLNE